MLATQTHTISDLKIYFVLELRWICV